MNIGLVVGTWVGAKPVTTFQPVSRASGPWAAAVQWALGVPIFSEGSSSPEEEEEPPRTGSRARRALRTAVLDLCELYGVPLDQGRRAQLTSLDAVGLGALRAEIRRLRAWPRDTVTPPKRARKA